MYPLDDTIVAIASAPGGAARGILRLSGLKAIELAGCVFSSEATADLGNIKRSQSLEGLVSFNDRKVPARLFAWPNERSYTRQRVAEIHTFGSPPILETIVQSLCDAGARLAQPGEFTLRAFLAG